MLKQNTKFITILILYTDILNKIANPYSSMILVFTLEIKVICILIISHSKTENQAYAQRQSRCKLRYLIHVHRL